MRKQSISRPALRYIVAVTGGAVWLAIAAPDGIKSSPAAPEQAAIIIYHDLQDCAECHGPEDLNSLRRNHNRPVAHIDPDCSWCHGENEPTEECRQLRSKMQGFPY